MEASYLLAGLISELQRRQLEQRLVENFYALLFHREVGAYIIFLAALEPIRLTPHGAVPVALRRCTLLGRQQALEHTSAFC